MAGNVRLLTIKVHYMNKSATILKCGEHEQTLALKKKSSASPSDHVIKQQPHSCILAHRQLLIGKSSGIAPCYYYSNQNWIHSYTRPSKYRLEVCSEMCW